MVMETQDKSVPARRELRFYGAASDVMYAREPEVLMEGPAGTGKTHADLWKLCLACDKMPGVRCLLVRKTRASMSESVLVTLEEQILANSRLEYMLSGPTREHRSFYRHRNGSRIILGGMDRSDKVMSAYYDLILACEATELTEDDLEKLTTRLDRPDRRWPYGQIIAECNPSGANHWLNRRAKSGRMRRLRSRHQDNPTLWDHAAGDWTAAGRSYMGRLQRLTGHRLLRLYKGLWATAEGVVYETWQGDGVHIIDRFQIPSDWRRIRSIDFGYTNPFSCSWWAIDHDGRMYRYRQIYMSRRLVEDHARQIVELTGDEQIEATVCDHDAEDRATLERHGVPTVAAYKGKQPGIQAVDARLRRAGDGRPRIFFLRDSLIERDQSLREGVPSCTEEEFDGYIWSPAVDGKPNKEEPLDKDNHGLDETRYAVAYVDDIGSQAGFGMVLGQLY